MITDSNVRIPDAELPRVIQMIYEGKSGMDIFRAGIRNSNGVPVSQRQAQRYAALARKIIAETDKETLKNFINPNTYMPDYEFEELDTDYPQVLVPQVKNRSCVFDIEVNAPVFGRMTTYSTFLICASFYPLDEEKPYTLTIDFDEQRNDKWLLYDVLNELAKYTFVIGHNIKGYDINWLMTRVMHHSLKVPKRVFYYDTYQAAKRVPVMTKKSLGHLMDFFRYDGAEKTSINPQMWDRIQSNKKRDFDEALKEIVYHCENDVIGNKYIYDVLMTYDPRPSWGLCFNSNG